VTALVLLNLTLLSSLPVRRLGSIFGFEVPSSLGDLQSQAATFLGGAGGQIAAAAAGAAGLSSIVTVLTESQGLLAKGVELLQTIWASFEHLAAELAKIFATFGPLEPIFASSTGLVQLVTSAVNMQTLVTVVQQLLNTSGTLEALSSACSTVVDIFQKLSATFSSAMGKLNGGSTRRLLGIDVQGRQLAAFSYDQLLNGIDFRSLISEMSQGLANATALAKTLSKVNTTLGPLLASLGGLAGRRLGNATAEQEKYQIAIEQIVPAWKGVESLGITMCPQVLSAQEVATSLVCRVNGFVGGNGALGSLSNLLGSCPASGAGTSPKRSLCPAKSKSAGVTDLLSKNSAALGWILYVVAGLIGLGVLGGGAVGAAQAARGGDESGEESDSEAPFTEDEKE